MYSLSSNNVCGFIHQPECCASALLQCSPIAIDKEKYGEIELQQEDRREDCFVTRNGLLWVITKRQSLVLATEKSCQRKIRNL